MPTLRSIVWPLVCCTLLSHAAGVARSPAADSSTWDVRVARELQIHGGLCVLVGVADPSMAAELAQTGRMLVQILVPDQDQVTDLRRRIQADARYGLISVDRLLDSQRLPYCENLVNLLVVEDLKSGGPACAESQRVLCPGGTVLVREEASVGEQLRSSGFVNVRSVELAGRWVAGVKPWPDGMDEWTHSRHSAAGNPVSRDMLTGPPRRVRWVVGAESEVAGIVTAGGRNYYAAALARDSFNGLRLWNRDLINPAAAGEFALRNLPGNLPAPVAAGRRLFAVSGGKVLALDGATGETIREFTEAGQPQALLHDRGLLIVADASSVRAVDAESGRLLWSCPASAPKCLVGGDEYVGFLQGDPRRGERLEAVVVDRSSGKMRWKRDDLEWAARVYRCVYHAGLLAYEVSTLNDDGPGNVLHILAADDGQTRWDREFLPGMNHARQARAMFVEDRLWLLHGGKGPNKERHPIECSALDPVTGQVLQTYPAGLAHCFPPVATANYLLAGEMDLTNLHTGEVDANRITKAACGRESGWMPANGLIYVTPKHCVCWPMLRGYAALAPARPEGDVADIPLESLQFSLETGVAADRVDGAPESAADWPSYRHDAWRSGSTTAPGPTQLDTLWTAQLGSPSPAGPLVADWQENPFVKGPVTSPVIAGDTLVIARPDAHEVVALDAATGDVRWRYTACGRVDTAPTLYNGLCLFGTKSGRVYCLRLSDGQAVWIRSAAPLDERIVAYGQLESPWPVPGSVLVSDGVAYFAAGRQSFADGGIFVFAVDPSSGALHWVQRLDTVPQKGFYECSALEFDNFDLLYRQGDEIAMSRWAFRRQDGSMTVDRWSAFARLNTGNGESLVPRGSWSYAPRHQKRIAADSARKPLAVFRDSSLFGCPQGMRSVFRRNFTSEEVANYETNWITGWAAGQAFNAGQKPWPNDRLADKAAWRVDLYAEKGPASIEAMALAADRLFVVASNGELQVLAADTGIVVGQTSVPAPLWDGMAVAHGRLYIATQDGQLVCLGEKAAR